jgi:hypothetical protein
MRSLDVFSSIQFKAERRDWLFYVMTGLFGTKGNHIKDTKTDASETRHDALGPQYGLNMGEVTAIETFPGQETSAVLLIA